MHPADLEALAHRRLAQLPPPRAPETLAPRVLAAVRRPRRRPWYLCSWFDWPRTIQAASAAAVAVLLWLAGSTVEQAAGGAEELAGGLAARIDGAVAGAGEISRIARVLWRVFLEPSAGYLIAVIGVMCAAGAVFCIALTRVLWEGSASR